MYPEEDPLYYLRLVKKLPISFDEPLVSWASIHQKSVYIKKRNYAKWNQLGMELVEAQLVEIFPRSKSKRNFI